jgi:hypothetical protein
MSNNRYDSRPTEPDAEEVAYDAIGGGGESNSGYMDVPAGGRLPLHFVFSFPLSGLPFVCFLCVLG